MNSFQVLLKSDAFIKGLLDRDLLEHVWTRTYDSEERIFLLDLMEKFDLLCAKRSLLPDSQSIIANHPGIFHRNLIASPVKQIFEYCKLKLAVKHGKGSITKYVTEKVT